MSTSKKIDAEYYRNKKDYIVVIVNGKECVFHKDDVNVKNKIIRLRNHLR